jgi:putative phage-type endonuclease
VSAVLLGQETPNTPAWDALRSNGLGGSEIAAVVGLSPWVSRFALYHRKRGDIPRQFENPSMNWGHRLEPVVLEAFAERHGALSDHGGTYRHDERTWQLANIDALLNGVPVDAKTADKYDGWKWGPDGSDEVPPYYRCQMVWYGDVFGVRTGHIAALIGGNDFRCYELRWSQDEAEWLREEGRKFWQDVLDGNAPPIDGHTATYEAVRDMHPDIERSIEVELDPDLYAQYVATKASCDIATAEHKRAKSRVLEQMGQAQFAAIDGQSVLRRQPGRGGTVSLYEVKAPKGNAA